MNFKKIIVLFFFIYGFQTYSIAEDINELEIEGISIGDSALNFFSIQDIQNNTWEYPNKEFKRVQNDNYDFFVTYDAVDFHYKSKDKKYIIHSLSGILIYENNIEKCYDEMDKIVSSIKNLFSSDVLMNDKTTFSHPSPKNTDGKSKVTVVGFEFKNGDEIDIACYDFSEIHGSQDHLNVNISTSKFANWLSNKAYK